MFIRTYSDIRSYHFLDTNIFGYSFVSKSKRMSHSVLCLRSGFTSPPTSRFPSGFAPMKSLEPQEISRSLGIYNPTHPSSRQCRDTKHPSYWQCTDRIWSTYERQKMSATELVSANACTSCQCQCMHVMLRAPNAAEEEKFTECLKKCSIQILSEILKTFCRNHF